VPGRQTPHRIIWTISRKFRLVAGALLLLELLSGRPTFAGPQVANFHHTKWTSENGLGAVFDIKQSPEGYLWLTTSTGVLRFDGVRFQPVAEVTYGAVDTNDIDSVFLPSSGGLWLTTMSSGLLFRKDGRLTAFPDRRCTPTRKMGRLVEDRDGSLWFRAQPAFSICEARYVSKPELSKVTPAGSRPAFLWIAAEPYG
jgi:ligand-binding sensor domain-containing protein